MSQPRRFYVPHELASILLELEKESDGESVLDFSDDSEGEEEHYDVDKHSSESELSAEEDVEVRERLDFDVFLGKNNETIWLSDPLAFHSTKTKSKNILKILPGPNSNSKGVTSELELFFKYFPVELTDKIVYFTNLYIGDRRESAKHKKIEEKKRNLEKEISMLLQWPK